MVVFREISIKDKNFFLSSAEQFYNSPAVLHSVSKDNFINTFNDLINNSPYEKGYIFQIDNKPVGYALLSFTWSNEAGGLVVLIEEVFVLENFRGKGIGTKFFEFIENEFPKAKRFRLEVEADNSKAIMLYLSKGFKNLDYVQMIKEK